MRVDDRTLARLGRFVGGGSAAIALVAVGTLAIVEPRLLGEAGVIHLALWALGMGSLAWVMFQPQPRNLEVWALASAGFYAAAVTAGMAVFAMFATPHLRSLTFEELLTHAPSELPASAALGLNAYVWAWLPAYFVVLTLGLVLFPNGRPPTARWRWLAWVSFITFAAVTPLAAWDYRPAATRPYGASATLWENALVVLVFGLAVASVVSLALRYRRSSGDVRHQIRWIAWAGAFLGVTMLVLIVNETDLLSLSETFALVLLGAAEALVIGSFWVAITKYRLYDIDIVISKTVTYGALALFITATYVAIVVGLGNLIGSGEEPNLVLAIGATAVVALLFQPVRSWVQHLANRLVYGMRATPYETLARFSQRAATAESDEEVLERIPRLIVDGTGATQATLWTTTNGELQPAATWPEGETPADADYSVPVEHQGEVLGAITMSSGRGEAIAPAEEELVQNLAGGLGLALRNARLTDDLRAQVDELAASRERILSAADEARRGLERDLDMGPQQELVAVKVKLGVVKTRAQAQNAEKTAEVLEQLEADTGAAIESVRDFARGVYPPLLEADGLAAAVSAEGAKAAVPVTIDAGGVGRYPREIETAVFFSILEALQNAAKYSEGSSVAVKLEDDGERLAFSVADDGTGFDPQTVDAGSGLPGMADRLDAAGGTLGVDSAPGQGTVVSGSVPI